MNNVCKKNVLFSFKYLHSLRKCKCSIKYIYQPERELSVGVERCGSGEDNFNRSGSLIACEAQNKFAFFDTDWFRTQSPLHVAKAL